MKSLFSPEEASLRNGSQTPSPGQRMESQELFHRSYAQGKGATGPRDGQEGHGGATGWQVTGSNLPLALQTRR